LARLDRLTGRCEDLIADEGAEKIVSPLDGNELMQLTGRGPGRWIQEVKDHLLDLVLDGELGRDDKQAATTEALRFLEAAGAARPSGGAEGREEGQSDSFEDAGQRS